MRQGCGKRLWLAAIALAAATGLLAAPALAGNKHSHRIGAEVEVNVSLSVLAAGALGDAGVAGKSVDCPKGTVFSHIRSRTPSLTVDIALQFPVYLRVFEFAKAPGRVDLLVQNRTQRLQTVEVTVVCKRLRTKKAAGHTHKVKPKVEDAQLELPADPATAQDVACSKPSKFVPAAVGLEFFENASFADKLRALFLGYPLEAGAFGARTSAPPSATAAGGGGLIWVVILLNLATEAATAEIDVLCTPRKTSKARAGGSATAAAKRHSHKIKHRLGEGDVVTVPFGTQIPGQPIVPGEAKLTVSCKKNERPLGGGLDPETGSDPPLELIETRTSKRKLTAEVANYTGADSTVRLTALCERKKTAKARG